MIIVLFRLTVKRRLDPFRPELPLLRHYGITEKTNLLARNLHPCAIAVTLDFALTAKG
jgi:hypothetical protein